MVLDQDLAFQRVGQRLHAQVTGLVLTGGALLLIFARLDPGLAIDRHIAHAGARLAPLGAIDTLGIFATGHLQAIGRAGEFHPLHGARLDILQDHAAAAEQIARPRQDLKRGDAAIGERATETGILRPDRMFGPDMGRDRRGHFIAVRMRIPSRRGIDAEMAVNVDDAGRHIFAGAVEHRDVGRDRRVRAADRGDLATRQEDDALVDPPALTIEDGRAADRRGDARIGLVGRRIGIVRLGRTALRRRCGLILFLLGDRRRGHAGRDQRQPQQQLAACVHACFPFSAAMRSRCIMRFT